MIWQQRYGGVRNVIVGGNKTTVIDGGITVVGGEERGGGRFIMSGVEGERVVRL